MIARDDRDHGVKSQNHIILCLHHERRELFQSPVARPQKGPFVLFGSAGAEPLPRDPHAGAESR